jgi:hypothetical protein
VILKNIDFIVFFRELKKQKNGGDRENIPGITGHFKKLLLKCVLFIPEK